MTSHSELTWNGRERVYMELFNAGKPLSAVEVSRVSGLPLQQARNRIKELVRTLRVSNVGTQRNAMYVAVGARTMQPKEPEPVEPPRWRTSGVYLGETAAPARAGALDFLNAPSLEGGKRVKRRPPALMMAAKA